jgi:hypothetical protein
VGGSYNQHYGSCYGTHLACHFQYLVPAQSTIVPQMKSLGKCCRGTGEDLHLTYSVTTLPRVLRLANEDQQALAQTGVRSFK